MDIDTTKRVLESVLLAAGKPLDVARLDSIFDLGEGEDRPSREEIREAIKSLQEDYQGKGIELVQVASGYRFQVPQGMEPWVARLYEEKPPRYSRALLETLAIIAYRQPITRGEIEDIRGVAVSSNITKTLQEREWVRVIGHKDVPGKPAMFGTTREFLDYFSLKTLDELPSLAELRDLESFNPQLELGDDVPQENKNPQEGAEETADGDEGGELKDEADRDSEQGEEETSAPEQTTEADNTPAADIADEDAQQSEHNESTEDVDTTEEAASLSPGDELLAEFEDSEDSAER
ncbi:segregation and condensation protein B [gamma proteobacterium HTCC5015]|nr:segregation and condensation protein B [gamma proteobacterium HTCC5015]